MDGPIIVPNRGAICLSSNRRPWKRCFNNNARQRPLATVRCVLSYRMLLERTRVDRAEAGGWEGSGGGGGGTTDCAKVTMTKLTPELIVGCFNVNCIMSVEF